MSTFQSLPGFREFYPEDCAARNGLFNAWRGAARRQGFSEYDAPVLEPLELYLEKSGEEIRSQLFEFEDKGGRKVALRPEMTPSLARLVAARAGSLRKPVKWFSIGECYRYEKPQKGRGRSFYQLNADILGEPGVGADAECIALLVESLKACGLQEGEFEIRISDRKLWFLFLALWGFDAEQAVGLLAIIDKWARESKEEIKKKLLQFCSSQRLPWPDIETGWNVLNDFRQNSLPWLAKIVEMDLTPDPTALAALNELKILGVDLRDAEAKLKIFNELKMRGKEVQELGKRLTELGLEKFYRFDFGIVRGLAYYTGFVFEAFQTVGTARALAGGGRYDDLLKKLGGVDMPAVGFGAGDMTLTDLLQELKRPIGAVDKPDVYLVIGGDKERTTALELVGKLRAAGLAVDYPLKDEKFGKQFKAADQCGAKLAVILGPDEVAQGQLKIKDMRSGVEVVLPNDAGVIANVREIAEKGLSA